MKTLKLTAQRKKSLLAIVIILISYAAERLIEMFIPNGRKLGIVLAIVYTLILALTLYIIYSARDTYFGLMAALFGYKMMPVSISFLYSYSHSADLLYFIVKKAAMLMFLVLIYWLYIQQDKDKEKRVSAPTVLVLIFSVPFFTEISNALFRFFLDRTGSMLYGYLSQFAVYAFATFVIIGVAYYSGCFSLRFATLYEMLALLINTVKVGAKIGYRVLNGWHISKSFFVWIALYAVLMVCFAFALRLKERKAEPNA